MRPLPRKGGTPRILWFARKSDALLAKRFAAEKTRLSKTQGKATLKEFIARLDAGYPAINMQIGTLVSFLTNGRYLNTYEAAESQAKNEKRPIHELLRQKLGKWYDARLKTDRFLGTRFDTHYAFRSIGGTGPKEYGPCCVVLSKSLLAPCGTAFAGDSLRVIFDTKLRPFLTKGQAFEQLSTAAFATKLAVVTHKAFIEASDAGIDLRQLTNRLESRDGLLELHLHGPIRREDILHIYMDADNFGRLQRLVAEIGNRDPGAPLQYKHDEAAAFSRLIPLTRKYDISIVRV